MSTLLNPPPSIADYTEIAIFLHDLESLDECKCESQSHLPGICTQSVTHRARCCAYSLNICDNAATSIRDQINRNVRCADCRKPAKECWSVISL